MEDQVFAASLSECANARNIYRFPSLVILPTTFSCPSAVTIRSSRPSHPLGVSQSVRRGVPRLDVLGTACMVSWPILKRIRLTRRLRSGSEEIEDCCWLLPSAELEIFSTHAWSTSPTISEICGVIFAKENRRSGISGRKTSSESA